MSYSNEINWRSFVTEPFAAGVAIVPTFYGFQVKTALQTGAPIPKYDFQKAFKVGVSKAPFTGVMVGAQRILQNAIDEKMQKKFKKEKDIPMAVASATAVGTVTTPLMVMFTRMTNDNKSKKPIAARDVIAGAVIENGFLAGMGATDPVIKWLQSRFGKGKGVEYAGAFASGAAGAIAGHVGDSALTFWQNGIKIVSLSQFKRGMLVRSVAIGGYNCINKAAKEALSK